MRRLLLLAFLWGWSFLFIKVAVGGMTPTTVAAARITLGAITLHVLLRARGLALPRDAVQWRHFAVTAVFGSALPFTLLAWSEERITSALTSVLNASTPLFTAVAGAVILGERLTRGQAVGLAVGLAGVGVAAGLGGDDLAGASLSGGSAAVAAGACYGLAYAYIQRHLVEVPPVVAACGQLTAGAALLAPVAVATTAASGIDLAWHRVGAVVVLGVAGTGLAYVLNYRIVAELGPTRASLVTYLVPVVAVVVGVLVLREPFRWTLVAGGALIVAGIALVHHRNRPGPGHRPTLPAGAGAPLAVAAAVGVLLAGCASSDDAGAGGGNAATATCDPVVTEPLDAASSLHLLEGAPEQPYRSDPPTSGAHLLGNPPVGVLDAPLPRPAQVTHLERGLVLVQHRDLDAADRTTVEELAGDRVVVAPNPDLPAPVVATAWRTKQACAGVDVEALEAFVAAHAGHGPGGHDHGEHGGPG